MSGVESKGMARSTVEAESGEASLPDGAFSPDGVDLTLIAWMLELSPAERLRVAQRFVDTFASFRAPESWNDATSD